MLMETPDEIKYIQNHSLYFNNEKRWESSAKQELTLTERGI